MKVVRINLEETCKQHDNASTEVELSRKKKERMPKEHLLEPKIKKWNKALNHLEAIASVRNRWRMEIINDLQYARLEARKLSQVRDFKRGWRQGNESL